MGKQVVNIKILIVTHGEYGRETANTLFDIMGKSEDLIVYGVYRNKGMEEIKNDLNGLICDLIKNNSVLVFTDMLGGTPSNTVIPFLDKEKVDIITGVNLPMLITAQSKKNSVESLSELSRIVSDAGRKSIVNCGESISNA